MKRALLALIPVAVCTLIVAAFDAPAWAVVMTGFSVYYSVALGK
jgi:hypothetical protein